MNRCLYGVRTANSAMIVGVCQIHFLYRVFGGPNSEFPIRIWIPTFGTPLRDSIMVQSSTNTPTLADCYSSNRKSGTNTEFVTRLNIVTSRFSVLAKIYLSFVAQTSKSR